MEFQTFKKIINNICSADKFINDAQKFGIDLTESPLCECYGVLAMELFEIAYGEEGCDMVMEYLYKDADNHEVSGEYNGKPYHLETFEELWKWLEWHYNFGDCFFNTPIKTNENRV